jgi:glycerophosphoryl diester phosphodiesterase
MKNYQKILLGIVGTYTLLALFPRFDNVVNNPVAEAGLIKPLMIAHGGGNLEFPDNTLEAFYNAYSIDREVMLETDVSLTKDGVIILTHDTTLDRKTTLLNSEVININYADLVRDEVDFNYQNTVVPNSNGFNVSGVFTKYKTFDGREVTPLDVNYPAGVVARHPSKFLVTTLEELITKFPNNFINVEIKQTGDTGLLALAKVIELMERLDPNYNTFGRIVLASFHQNIYEELQRIREEDHPTLMYSPELMGVVKYFVFHTLRLDLFYFDRVSVLQVPMGRYGLNLATRGFVNTARKHNIAVHYWTINDEADMRLLVRNGAHGIMTDRPTLLKQIIDQETK